MTFVFTEKHVLTHYVSYSSKICVSAFPKTNVSDSGPWCLKAHTKTYPANKMEQKINLGSLSLTLALSIQQYSTLTTDELQTSGNDRSLTI